MFSKHLLKYIYRDHFLPQDQGIKTSYESGFSSSYNQTGNSKEMEYRSSQDLFSQGRSQDLLSQNDRTNSQFGVRLFWKYILKIRFKFYTKSNLQGEKLSITKKENQENYINIFYFTIIYTES